MSKSIIIDVILNLHIIESKINYSEIKEKYKDRQNNQGVQHY